MTWKRFGYICRKVNSTHQSGESISECIARIENDPGCKFYGSKILTDGLPRTILNDIGGLPGRDEAKESIKLYSEINLSDQLSEPMQFKRAVIYLASVAFIFLLVSSIYQLKVVPSFMSSFENLELSIPSHLIFYSDYWQYFTVFIFIILAGALAIGYVLRGLFQFRHGSENGIILRFFVIKGIRSSYVNMLDTLSFPISSSNHLITKKESPINSHLSSVKSSGMSISIEMQEIIKAQMNTLIELCERQVRLISVTIAVIVIAAIFFFLVSAYSPIFMLGGAI